MSDTAPEETPAQEPTPGQQDQPQDPSPADEPSDSETNWESEAKKWEKRSKENFARAKQLEESQSSYQSRLDAVAKELGLKDDDTPTDPAKLAEQITAAQGETATERDRADKAERTLAVFQSALRNGGNPAALVDSSRFMQSLAEVDTTDETALDEAVTKAIEANDHFKAAKATPPFGGGPRTPAPTKAGTLGDAIAARVPSATR